MPAFKNPAPLCLAVLLTLFSGQLCRGQIRESNLLDRRVEGVILKEPNINLALAAVAREYGIPIGIEMAAKGKNYRDKGINVSLARGTLRDLLNAIAENDARYTWEDVDGVVNVRPKVDRDGLLKELLGTKVQRFRLGKNPTTYAVRNSIVALPEIKSKLEGANITPFIVGISGIDFQRMGEDFSMSVSDVTLQELLNRIIKQSGVKFWILNRVGENNEFLIINF